MPRVTRTGRRASPLGSNSTVSRLQGTQWGLTPPHFFSSSTPPMYGLSASGTTTDPSACW